MAISIQHYAKRDQLVPLRELTANDRQLLFAEAKLREVLPRTLITAEDDIMFYLLEGEVTLLTAGFVTEQFIHSDNRALQVIFNEGLEEDSVLFGSNGVVLEIDKKLFEGLYLQAQAKSIEQSETELDQSEEDIFLHLLSEFQNKKLELPILPEAALKIRLAVNASDVGSQEIIDIVQTDAVLSARLLKVANSPLYGTWREIKTIKDAVRRLGVEATRNLSFSLSVHQLYHAKTTLIKNEMKLLYAQTRRISSLAFLLTKEFCPDLDPEQAVLSGLLQGVGILPILKYIDAHPHLAHSKNQLNKSIEKLKVPISVLLFNDWNFDPQLIEYIESSNDWQRNEEGEINFTDILIAARLLCLTENNINNVALPNLYTVPVMDKIGVFDVYDSAEAYLQHSREDASSMDSLLS